MTDFINCLAVEQGGYFAAAIALLCVAFAVWMEYLCVRVFFAILKRGVSTVELKAGDKVVLNTSGPATALVVVVIAAAILLAPVGATWYLYKNFQDYYSVAIDVGQSNYTLDALRADMLHDPHTHVSILIADGVKGLRLNGKFEGMCVADLFDGVCRLHADKLRCATSSLDRSITISERKK